jgi:hypothetical protein
VNHAGEALYECICQASYLRGQFYGFKGGDRKFFVGGDAACFVPVEGYGFEGYEKTRKYISDCFK